MQTVSIGQEVVRTKGDYVVGRTGTVVAFDDSGNRARVNWSDSPTTWVALASLEPTSTPYMIKRKYTSTQDRWGHTKFITPKYIAL
jgi:hypothetical protein